MKTCVLKYIVPKKSQDEGAVSGIECGDGTIFEIITPQLLCLTPPKNLLSGFLPPLEKPLSVSLAAQKTGTRPDTIEFWEPVADALAYSALARTLLSGREKARDEGKQEFKTEQQEVKETFDVRQCLSAIAKFAQITSALEPAWLWVLPDLAAQRAEGDARKPTTCLPPEDLLAGVAESGLKLEDHLSKLLVLGVAHAIGQESVLLHAGWGEIPEEPWTVSNARRKHWFVIQSNWLDYLSGKLGETVDVRVVLARLNGEGLKRLASSWLPVASLRAVCLQLKRNIEGRAREDFVTRIGMALPWDERTVWASQSQPATDVPFCDAWPCPLDNLHWWQECLRCIALKLFEDALLRGKSNPLDVLNLEVPFFRQSLAATLALAKPLRQHYGKNLLTKAAEFGEEIAASPNPFIPHLARLITQPRVIQPSDFFDVANDPAKVAEGVATPAGPGISYPDISLLLPNSKKELRVEFADSPIVMADAGRNLSRDVKWALGQMERFRRFQRHEAEMFLWWRGILADAPTDLDFAFGTGWVWKPKTSLRAMTAADYPPSARCKDGWISWVIAMWARNEHLPPNLALPTLDELNATRTGAEQDDETLDVIASRAGTPPEADPYHKQRRPSGTRAVRLLALHGWLAKRDAQDRILQWLAEHQPQSGSSSAFFFTSVCCSIAAARWIHEHKDRKTLGVFRRLQENAEALPNDPDAANAAAWLDAYLTHQHPFPTR
ncbi:MAG: hypothetical protein BroJett014_03960 [Planctomycetota bacterium]|nr:MAG: hypothetical protein BroJett014_03960 [Planctomycetota bacterium]